MSITYDLGLRDDREPEKDERDKMIRILFDGPPSHESGRFIEVENEKGESINLGEWVQDGDYWVLQFPDHRKINADLLEALRRIGWMLHDVPLRIQSIARHAIDKAKTKQ